LETLTIGDARKLEGHYLELDQGMRC